MKQNELSKYEFELLASTELMARMIVNRLVVTTDSLEDHDKAFDLLDEIVTTGMFYTANISPN